MQYFQKLDFFNKMTMFNNSNLHFGSIIRVTSRRFIAETWSQEMWYFISSITHNKAPNYAPYVRAHWGVKNSLHTTGWLTGFDIDVKNPL
jgi:predicted transposase YbfD/YdcC